MKLHLRFWKGYKVPKRGRPAKSPIENLERRVSGIIKVITEHDNRISDLEKPKETGDGK